MTRIIDYAPSDEQSLVSRVLIAVHKAIDDAFPDGAPSARHEVKTQLAAGQPGSNQSSPSRRQKPVTDDVRQNEAAFSHHASGFSQVGDENDFDLLIAERQKKRKWVFFVIMIATAAFVALALILANRNLG